MSRRRVGRIAMIAAMLVVVSSLGAGAAAKTAAVPASPSVKPSPQCTSTHRVLANDSWTRLAARFKVPQARLLRLNSASLTTPLFVGDTVCLAVRSTSSSAGGAAGTASTTTTTVAPTSTTTTTTTTTTTVASTPTAPTVTVADPVACRPIQVSWRGASPDTGLYSLQWVRVSAAGTYDFREYTMWNVRGTSTAMPNWLAHGATYALRIYTMRADWDGLTHSNQNVTPHSAIVTFTLPSCNPPTTTNTTTTTTTVPPTWSQRGVDLDGEAITDFSGEVAISSDGSVVAIGAYGNNENDSDSGHVRVYAWNGSAWVQRGSDINGEASGDLSGAAVALSSDGSIVAIGAYLNDGNGADSGHVRVYAWDGSVWVQRGSDINGESSNDSLGVSVALSSDGTIVATGAYLNDGNGTNSGHVRVYAWDGSAWVQRGSDIDGEAAGDHSGRSVSISDDGSVVAIGARNNSGSFTSAGHVRVYSWNGTSWVQRGNDINGEAAGDLSGRVSLSSDGTVVAIGATENNGGGSDSGHVRVYSWNGTSWVQRGTDIDGEAANNAFGVAVSLSSDGTVLAAGAIYNDGTSGSSTDNRGHVRVFVWDGSSWVQRGSDFDGEAAGDEFGRGVALSRDGTVFAAGAEYNDGSASDAGHVRVYRWS